MGIPSVSINHRAGARRRRVRSRFASQSDRRRGDTRSNDGRCQDSERERVRFRTGRSALGVSITEGSSAPERHQAFGGMYHSRSSDIPHHRIRRVRFLAVSATHAAALLPAWNVTTSACCTKKEEKARVHRHLETGLCQLWNFALRNSVGAKTITAPKRVDVTAR